MTKEELVKNLGTIAHSGTGEYLKEVAAGKDASGIIGQFGVGFYSCFMVSNHVEVFSKNANEGQPGYRWMSDGYVTESLEVPADSDVALEVMKLQNVLMSIEELKLFVILKMKPVNFRLNKPSKV